MKIMNDIKITKEEITGYLEGFYQPHNPFLDRMREEAEAENIPIIQRETESFLLLLQEMNRPCQILEIGTAVGYSALLFAMADEKTHVTTLEIQERLCGIARQNFEKSGAGERIRMLHGDARESLKLLAEEKESCLLPAFDFVFIDGATNHYKEIWDGCIGLCRPGAIIVADNIFFKGMTISDKILDHPRNKTIAGRMRAFISHITTDPNIKTAILPVGDGIAVSIIL